MAGGRAAVAGRAPAALGTQAKEAEVSAPPLCDIRSHPGYQLGRTAKVPPQNFHTKATASAGKELPQGNGEGFQRWVCEGQDVGGWTEGLLTPWDFCIGEGDWGEE